jgi:tetratricopeptide (TPR) repeat protein
VRGMPHLTELQKKYREKGLTIIGTTHPDRNGNTLEKVEAMVADKGDEGMGYSVAWDGSSKTADAYMRAAQQNGIPCAFLVDKEGRVAYIGHPMKIDATLEDVVAGTHDIKDLAAKYAKAHENEAKANELMAQLNQAGQAKDWDKLIAACDALIALDPEQYGGMAGTKFLVTLNEKKDDAAAFAYVKSVLAGFGKDNAQLLNQLAWTMVDPEKPLPKNDLDLALQLAQRAVEITKRKEPAILDTLARVHFTKGQIDQAITVETEAVALDPKLQSALDEYKKAKDSKKVGG